MRSRYEILSGLETDPDFLARVDQWVETAARGRPPAGEFLALLPGVWPGEATASLRRLEHRGVLPQGFQTETEATLRQSRQPSQRRYDSAVARLGFLEHPLDFEWLFTQVGQDTILREVRQACAERVGTVLCLGCPTLFERGKRLMPEQQFVLWDKNATSLGQLSEAHSLADIDLRHEPLPSLAAIAAIIDPPWYNDFFRLFLWAALRNVRPGGTIFMSFPPEGTRPSAARDLTKIIQWAKDAGAELLFHQRGRVPYRSPLFEVNALAAAGLPGVPLDWRRGDLVAFRKQASIPVSRPIVRELDARWSEHRIGCLRWWVQAAGAGAAPGSLRSVWKAGVLPSVSTRFPRRHLANVVTSGNRFFQSVCPDRIAEFCRGLAPEGEALRVEETTASAAHQAPLRLARLIAAERHEAEEYFIQTDGL